RAMVTDVLQFIQTATATTNKTASVGIAADGPVSTFAVVTDKTSKDGSMVMGQTSARGAARMLVPYSSNVGAYKTWLFVRNVGPNSAVVDMVARGATGAQIGSV